MTLEQQIERELAFFSDEEHSASFELLLGVGRVMLSAPHAVLQTRHGAVKCAERFTGMLCRLVHRETGCPVIYKTRHLLDDANHDEHSDYRDALCQYIRQSGVKLLLDLHQLAPERPMALCICTGLGEHLLGQKALVETIRAAFLSRGLGPVTVDDPFTARSAHTVSRTVATRCGVAAVQLELNTALLMKESDNYRFADVLYALCELTDDARRDKGERA